MNFFKQNLFLVLAVFCFLTLTPLDDVKDTLDFHPNNNIFPDTEFWDHHDWKKKFVDRDPEKGLKTLIDLGFVKIPQLAWMNDGWHLAKFIMHWQWINVVIFMLFWFPIRYNVLDIYRDCYDSLIDWIKYHKFLTYIIIAGAWAILDYVMHCYVFFGGFLER
jgi:hypothetical protein